MLLWVDVGQTYCFSKGKTLVLRLDNDVVSVVFCCSLSADEALQRVQRAFDTRKDNERRSPETDQQHQMVRDYVAKHQARQTGTVHKE